MNLSLASLILVFAPGPLLAAAPVEYLREVKPILAESCYRCHSAAQQKSGLRLDTAALARKGGERGSAVQPGASSDSLLVRVIEGSHSDIPRMPYKKPPLNEQQIALIKAWIDQGAHAPTDEKPESLKHWAFVPPTRSAAPRVKNRRWVRNPIDQFTLARLEQEGIKPSAGADRATLLRRVSLDLTGLPPTPEEAVAFPNDRSREAYETVVERLLASPHYGERWGRWWLDAARYADSNGYSIDSMRSIWPYRDWVVNALNRDLSFDQFTTWQLAGDLLPNATTEQLVATGFHRNTQVNHEGGIDLEQFRIESAMDRVNTTATVWLGLTLGCAQCHDHKFDPITQREYYRFFAFFNQQENDGHGNVALEAINLLELGSPDELTARSAHREKVKGLEKELNDWIEKELKPKQAAWEGGLDEASRERLKPEVRASLSVPVANRNEFQASTVFNTFRDEDARYLERRKALDELKKSEPKITTTLVMKECAEPRETHLMIKGDFTRPGERVEPGTPVVLGELHTIGARSSNSALTANAQHAEPALRAPTRLDLAQWLISPENPLTARVIMNRVWQQYFGKGLVETDNDFGLQGARPANPELLDWLATEFMARGWSLKAMHRLIVTSATYRQASGMEPLKGSRVKGDSGRFNASTLQPSNPRQNRRRTVTSGATSDPQNKLLWRQNRIRLDAELIRDVSLAASGLLDPRLGGPPVFPPQPEGLDAFTQNKREWKASTGGDRFRRGFYTHIQRTRFHPALAVFDAPDSYTTCTRRLRSNTPLQALTLLNDQQFVELADGFAERLQAHTGSDDAKLEFGFRCCLAREPRNGERQRLERLLSDERKAQAGEKAAWTTVARVLLNLDETITRE